MTHTEWQREARKKATAAGLCGTCRVREPSPGNRTCDTCIAGAVRRRRGGDGFCVACAAHGFHRVGCTDVPKAVKL